MKTCKNCGTVHDGKFCPNCGTPCEEETIVEEKTEQYSLSNTEKEITEFGVQRAWRKNDPMGYKIKTVLNIITGILLVLAIALAISIYFEYSSWQNENSLIAIFKYEEIISSLKVMIIFAVTSFFVGLIIEAISSAYKSFSIGRWINISKINFSNLNLFNLSEESIEELRTAQELKEKKWKFKLALKIIIYLLLSILVARGASIILEDNAKKTLESFVSGNIENSPQSPNIPIIVIILIIIAFIVGFTLTFIISHNRAVNKYNNWINKNS